jgi:hypothetical protein
MANFHHKKNSLKTMILTFLFGWNLYQGLNECVSFKSNNWLCNPIHGWVDWMRFWTKASSRGKMGVERGSGYQNIRDESLVSPHCEDNPS